MPVAEPDPHAVVRGEPHPRAVRFGRPQPGGQRQPNPGRQAPVPEGPQEEEGRGLPKKASSITATAPGGLEISEAQFSLTTGTAVMDGATYEGTAEVPTASGAKVKMLKFHMSSLTLTGSPTLTVAQNGQSAETSGSSMHFSGDVVLYVTKLSGHLLGIPLTLTPGSPLALFTSLLNGIPLTGVTTDQPLISAAALAIPGLQVNAG